MMSRQRNAAAVLLEWGARADLAEPALEVRQLGPLRHQLHVAAAHHADRDVATGKIIARDEAGLAELLVKNPAGPGRLLLAGVDRPLVAFLGRRADQAPEYWRDRRPHH